MKKIIFLLLLFSANSFSENSSPNLSDQGFDVKYDESAPDLASKGFDMPSVPKIKKEIQQKNYNAAAPFLNIQQTKEAGNKLIDPTAPASTQIGAVLPEVAKKDEIIIEAPIISKENSKKENKEKIKSDVSQIVQKKSTIFAIDPLNSSIAKTLLGDDKVKSLMFDDEDLGYQERALEASDGGESFKIDGEENEVKIAEKKEEENYKSFIYLSSLIYSAKNNWSIWLNEKKFSSNNNFSESEFYIKNINNEKATIKWTISSSKWRILTGHKDESEMPKLNSKNQVEIVFSLHPNQTFILGPNKIIEGKLY